MLGDGFQKHPVPRCDYLKENNERDPLNFGRCLPICRVEGQYSLWGHAATRTLHDTLVVEVG